MQDYIAIIHKDPDSDYEVSFPDFPGCICAGANLDEARDMAAEALSFHIEGLEEYLPEPSTFEQIMSNAYFRDGAAILVRAPDKKHAGELQEANAS
jgi:predicted RNase H-like HicB family nuclease